MENNKEEAGSKLESLDRISKLPVVESTVNVAHNMYDKIKESHAIVNSVLTTAESTLKQATEAAQPYANKLEGPIKKVDSILCSSLDYVEEKIPAIKLPPGEMYENTKTALNSTVAPAVNKACEMTKTGAKTLNSFVFDAKDPKEEKKDETPKEK